MRSLFGVARWRMAAQADFVIEGGVFNATLVGVMARCAGQSRFATFPAAALL